MQRSESSDGRRWSANLRARRVNGSRVQRRVKGIDERERARSDGTSKSVHKREVHWGWRKGIENGRRRSFRGIA